MIHIIYIPGLGDRYDFLRRAGLLLWRRKNVVVTHLPMRWRDPYETYEEKLERIRQLIDTRPDAETVLVGESAGGAMAIASLGTFSDRVDHVVTLCGMNQGSANVNPNLYRKNPAFEDTMIQADRVVSALDAEERKKLYIIYSSRDYTVRPKNTLIEGVESHDLRIFGHMPSILAVLYWCYRLILKKVSL